jgi:hypothetical protein
MGIRLQGRLSTSAVQTTLEAQERRRQDGATATEEDVLRDVALLSSSSSAAPFQKYPTNVRKSRARGEDCVRLGSKMQ